MTSAAATKKAFPISIVAIGVAAVLIVAALVLYLSRSSPAPDTKFTAASAQAKGYVKQLALSDVTIRASESFMHQQLVEVEGKITNRGGRPLKSIDVYCLFYNTAGQEIHRERTAVLPATGSPLNPGQTRAFRLPFDALPEGWNQALPNLVIAGIVFAD